MFEDLIPSAQAQTLAPTPGLFDDLIPAGAAAGGAGGMIAEPPSRDATGSSRESAKAGDGDDRPFRNVPTMHEVCSSGL